MSVRIKEYKFFRSLSVKVNDNWPVRKAEQLWKFMRNTKIAEIEAVEACKWLRATGFPQYARMYEDMQFPIDISQVELDHPALEKDVLRSLYRRLKILNGCAPLHQQRVTHTDESDDDDCALSENWTYENNVRRWSRACPKGPIPNLEDVFPDDVEPSSPRERLRRTGSNKFRRRRDGVVYSDSSKESCSSIIKSLELNHLSDSEITPTHQRKLRTKSFDKTDIWACSPSSVNRLVLHKRPEVDVDQIEATPEEVERCGEQISLFSLSATQLQVLRKLALLKLTAHMEKYCPSHRTGWNWDLPKFIRKMKTPPVYKDKNVFGVPLSITLQRTGQVLPRNIEEALRWLQLNAADQVGIFRKPGVKSRIQSLRNLAETETCVDYSTQQSYDVADMVKQYFRDLPETLLTNKLSETFILIFQHGPAAFLLRREAVLCALLLMPNEHLELLQALLHFLLEVAKHCEINQMNEGNLAMCFAPSLFRYSQLYKQTAGSPHPKELAENKAGYDCLYFLLKNYNTLFKIPQDFIKQCKSCDIKEPKVKHLNDLRLDTGGWKEYLDECESRLLKETKERQRGWVNVSSHFQQVDIGFKKVADGVPLKLWKVTAEIEAPPSEVLRRVLRERHVWDPELKSAKIVAQLDGRSEIFQYVRNSIAPRPAEDYCVVRSWSTDAPRNSCVLVETSVEYPDAGQIPNSSRGVVYASRYLVEPCGSGKSRLIHLSRIDMMGRAPDWYHKHFGHLQALFIRNIQKSFSDLLSASGPESKV